MTDTETTSLELARASLAEFIGTAFLLAGVVGSGIMAENLTGDVGLQLLANSTATVGVLVALILMFADTSGAHFNPAVTLTDFALGGIDARRAGAYIAAQVSGGATVSMVGAGTRRSSVVVDALQAAGGGLVTVMVGL